MALGEEKAEAAAAAKARALGGGAARIRSWTPQGLRVGSSRPTCKPRGPASPVRGAQGLPAPVCHGGTGPGPSGACQPQASGASREPAAGGSKPALGSLLPPASLGTGDWCSVRSQVGAEASGAVASPKAVL